MTRPAAPRSEIDEPPSTRQVEDMIYPHRKALAALMHSEALSRGDVAGALQLVTEIASQVLRVERASVWRFREDRGALECANLFQRTPHRHSDGGTLLASSNRRYFEALAEERSIAVADAFVDARTVDFTENYLRRHGISAMLDAPVFVRGNMVGVVCHEHVGGRRTWLPWEELVAGSIADFVALAMEAAERNRAKQELEGQVRERTIELTRANERLVREARERERAEARVRHSEDNLRKLFEVSPISLILTSAAEKRVIFANRRTSELFEIDPDKMVGQRPTDFYVRPEERDRLLERVESEGHVDNFEAVLQTATGRVFPALISAQRLLFNGEPAIVVSALDISAQKAVEEQLRELATRDSLTDCVNRRHFMEIAAKELERADRYGNRLSIAMIDVDHFKNVNDHYGHAAGDRVLRTIADRCRSALRKTDVLGRFGGEEFVVLFVETGLVEAERVAERLLTRVAEPMTSKDGVPPVTISAGVVERHSGETLDSMLNVADEALYQAKRDGRNRVVTSHPPPQPVVIPEPTSSRRLC
ncbi:MAG TPA: diguanylate cyclase [Polyangiaceae bacterium]|nr:diguanylate cyclase [Polyangiaceae bacterium]